MSVSSASASSNAYSYLQSLLQQGSTKGSEAGGSADPITTLLAAFYPAGAKDQSTSASTTGTSSPPSSMPCPAFSPDTLGALISMQGQQTDATGSSQAQ